MPKPSELEFRHFGTRPSVKCRKDKRFLGISNKKMSKGIYKNNLPIFYCFDTYQIRRHCGAGSNLLNFSSLYSSIGSLLKRKDCFLRRNDILFGREV
jgi:hypothetical protein